jgi:hypothetical protein
MPFLVISYTNNGFVNDFVNAKIVNEKLTDWSFVYDIDTIRVTYGEIPDGVTYYILQHKVGSDYDVSHWFKDMDAVHAAILDYIRNGDDSDDYHNIIVDEYVYSVLRSTKDDTFEEKVDELISNQRERIRLRATLIQLRQTQT